ncbi:hypothetical protein WME79_03745 [Sorangium sp. So ce726]|uniref:hypothetical protein n=1 Tax=Sorangium sp. So ce726 TaxID=3133319 RepID=UPI003F638BCE
MAISSNAGLCVSAIMISLSAAAGCGGDAEMAALGEVREALPASSHPGNPNPGLVVNPGARGELYSKLAARWWQWVFSIEGTRNPLFDATGEHALEGQSRPVYFLAGVYCIIQPDGSCDPAEDEVVRRIQIPPGVRLFFPIVNTEIDDFNLPAFLPPQCIEFYDPETNTVTDKPACATAVTDQFDFASATLDGVEIAGLNPPADSIYRVQSDEFSYTVPDDNIFDVLDVEADAMTVGPAITEGIYLLLNPLPPGEHTLHFEGASEELGFSLSITYIIEVTRGR